MAVRVKAYLYSDKQVSEVRYFSVPQDFSTNYEYWVNKVRQIFRDIHDKELKLFWKDTAQDLISFSSDEELSEALNLFSGTIFKLLITASSDKKKTQGTAKVVFKSIPYDWIGPDFVGQRSKTLQCPSYDLYSTYGARGAQTECGIADIHKPVQPKDPFARRLVSNGTCHQISPRGGHVILLDPFNSWEGKTSSHIAKCKENCENTNEKEQKEEVEEVDIAEYAKTMRDLIDSAFQAFMSYDPETSGKAAQSKQEETTYEVKAPEKNGEHSEVEEDVQVKVPEDEKVKNVENKSENTTPNSISAEDKRGACNLVEENKDFESASREPTKSLLDHDQSRLDDTLSLLEAMGFHNKDGQLASLIVAKDFNVGDIINEILSKGK